MCMPASMYANLVTGARALNLQNRGAGVKGSASCQYHSTFEMLQRIYRDPSLLRSHSNGVFFWNDTGYKIGTFRVLFLPL